MKVIKTLYDNVNKILKTCKKNLKHLENIYLKALVWKLYERIKKVKKKYKQSLKHYIRKTYMKKKYHKNVVKNYKKS